MNADGTGVVTIAEGIYHGINVTSTYVYFVPFGDDVPIYACPTYGEPYTFEFTQARDALLQNSKH